MKIYAFSGLGADERVFNYLSLDHELITIPWIEPKKNENISDYTQRLIRQLPIDEKNGFVWLGVSFGGIIAQEANKIIPAKQAILISTIVNHGEISWWKKLLGKTRFVRFIPNSLLKKPFFLISYSFGAQNKKLLKEIITDTDPSFLKWALQSLLTWNYDVKSSSSIIRIHGDQDKLLPYPIKDKDVIKISKGTHFMIVDEAEQISEIINQSVKIY